MLRDCVSDHFTCARDSISRVSRVTRAVERALGVGTVGVVMAVMSVMIVLVREEKRETLVDIFKENKIQNITAAYKL